jgi:hypothetical protein
MQANQRETLQMPTSPIVIRHNFTPDAFMWLWAKYVVGFNERYHCTNCLRGRYSHRFSKAKNPNLATEQEIVFDEHSGHRAIYICGVARKGYSGKKNYEHNVHLAIVPDLKATSRFHFEHWRVEVECGKVIPIPALEDLGPELRRLPDPYTSCRIFRWGSCFFASQSNHK